MSNFMLSSQFVTIDPTFSILHCPIWLVLIWKIISWVRKICGVGIGIRIRTWDFLLSSRVSWRVHKRLSSRSFLLRIKWKHLPYLFSRLYLCPFFTGFPTLEAFLQSATATTSRVIQSTDKTFFNIVLRLWEECTKVLSV